MYYVLLVRFMADGAERARYSMDAYETEDDAKKDEQEVLDDGIDDDQYGRVYPADILSVEIIQKLT